MLRTADIAVVIAIESLCKLAYVAKGGCLESNDDSRQLPETVCQSLRRHKAFFFLNQMSNVQVNVIPDLLPSFQPVKAIDFQFGDNYVLEVTANSQYAIASASDRLIRLYDLNNLELATTLKGHEGAITKIKLYGDQYLLSSSDDGQWVRWDLRTGAPAQTFKCKVHQNLLLLCRLMICPYFHLDTRYVSAFDLNCNDTMGILGTDSYGATQAAELVFFDTRKTDILSIFEESHGDDITDVRNKQWLMKN